MNYWLVKSEPFKYPWTQLVEDGSTFWDGVRNYQARNNMREMKKGDQVLFYHSNKGKEIVGIAKVVKEHYQDPTTEDGRWSVVDLAADRSLKRAVTLVEIKAEDSMQGVALIKQSRLSVMPLMREEFDKIIQMSED